MSEDEKKDDDATETPAEETKAEESKTDESKTEEAPAEESKAEEILNEESKASEVLNETSKAEEVLKAADEAKADEAKADEPKADEAKADEPAAEPEPEPEPEEPAVVAEPVSLGFLVEFETEEQLKSACERVRDAGYSSWDAHTPYAVHGLDEAMGIRPTILPWIVFFGGLTGCMVGLGLQFYTNGITLPFSLQGTLIDPFLPSGYPYVVSGKPIFSVPANIPVTFELTILLSAFGAFFGMWGLNRLPRFHHPVFHSERFRRSSQDRYFISIEADDPRFHRERTLALLQQLGGSHLEELVDQVEG